LRPVAEFPSSKNIIAFTSKISIKVPCAEKTFKKYTKRCKKLHKPCFGFGFGVVLLSSALHGKYSSVVKDFP
jgi:hypothetical protein